MKCFEKDDRVLLLDDISQFALCRNFNAPILCPYDPLTAAEQEDVMAFAREKTEGRDAFDADDSIDPLYPETWKEILEDYPPCLDMLKDGLRAIYKEVSGEDATTTSLRLNSTYPSWKHAHSEWAVLYPVSGSGSIGFDSYGMPYKTPIKHIFAIPPDFDHAAPADLAQDALRVTIALSRPEIG